jgi:hypothetical protein
MPKKKSMSRPSTRVFIGDMVLLLWLTDGLQIKKTGRRKDVKEALRANAGDRKRRSKTGSHANDTTRR